MSHESKDDEELSKPEHDDLNGWRPRLETRGVPGIQRSSNFELVNAAWIAMPSGNLSDGMRTSTD